MNRDDIEM